MPLFGTELVMRRKLFRRRTPPGSVPGRVVSDPQAAPTEIQVIAYNTTELVEESVTDPSELPGYLERYAVTWVNVNGLGDAKVLKQIARLFGLHALALEDVVHVHQRPKVEDFADHLFIVARMVTVEDEPAGYEEPQNGAARLDTEQISIFLGKNFVVTFQERPGDCLNAVRERMRQNTGLVRKSGGDYLAYALLDAVVDAYFPVVEKYSELLDILEEQVTESHDRAHLDRIHRAGRALRVMRRAAWPLRDAVQVLQRDEHPLILPETRIYLRDCSDHTVQIIDFLETSRELCADLREYYFSTLSHRTNEIMKVLTIIATIFIPLSFVAGVYGMNFDPAASEYNMPELRWRYGYPFAWSVMGVIALALLAYFRRKGWLGR